jgi:folate-dependent tRNA-U54 methylase TrmFO/GidA
VLHEQSTSITLALLGSIDKQVVVGGRALSTDRIGFASIAASQSADHRNRGVVKVVVRSSLAVTNDELIVSQNIAGCALSGR